MFDSALAPGAPSIRDKYTRETIAVLGGIVLLFDAALAFGIYSRFNDTTMAVIRILPSSLVVVVTYLFLWSGRGIKVAAHCMVFGFAAAMILARAISSPDIETMFLNLPALWILAVFLLGFKTGMAIGIGVFSTLLVLFTISTKSDVLPIMFQGEPNVSVFSGPILMLYLVVQIGRFLRDLAHEGIVSNRLMSQYLENQRQLFSLITHDISNLLFITSLGMESGRESAINQTIDQMLELTQEVKQIHAGTVPQAPTKGTVSLNSVLDAAQFVFAIHLKAKSLKLSVDNGGAKDSFVWSSSAILSHVILNNLLSNAIKFSPEHSVVRIVINESAKHVVLDVIDQGEGISDNVVRAVVAGQVVNSTPGTKGETGTGFGLKNARDMAHRLGIELEFHRGDPRGTIARLIIPRSQ